MKKLWPWVVVVGAIALALWLGTSMAAEQATNAKKRFTYTGHVTAVQQGDSITTVYLNSDGQVVKVYGTPLTLQVGQEYEIILDGNGRLVNARIIGE